MASLEIHYAGEGLRAFELVGREVVVGRHAFCNLIVDSQGVSRRHARITHQEEGFFIEDLGSVNGTFLNRKRIQSATRLEDGDTIHFYRVSAVFRASEIITLPVATAPTVTVDSPTPPPGLESRVVEADSQIVYTGENQGRLQPILKVVASLGRSLELEEVLANILDGFFDVFSQTRRGNIWLIDDDAGELVLRATKETGSQTLCSESFGPLNIRLRDDVIARRKAMLTVNELDECFESSVFDVAIKSSLCSPLPGANGEVLGAIHLETDDRDDPFAEEDLTVLTSVCAVAGQATEYARQHELMLARAVELTSEQARRGLAEDKLSAAESVQQSLYPNGDPELPGFEIAGAAFPTEAGCGDYFDFITLPDGRLAIAVGDVSGHGLAAALYMVQTRSYVRAFAAQGMDAARLLGEVNRFLCRDIRDGQFVSLILAIIDPVQRRLTWSSAGHVGFHLSNDGVRSKIESDNIVLGVAPTEEFVAQSMELQSGDLIALPTDGFFEVFGVDGELLGINRLLDEIESHRNRRASEVITGVYQKCLEFSDHAPLTDDMTCVFVKVL